MSFRETFEGMFEEGAKHGKGTFAYPDGTKIRGTWNMGQREGESTWTDIAGGAVIEVKDAGGGQKSRQAHDRSGAVAFDMQKRLEVLYTPQPVHIYKANNGGAGPSKEKLFMCVSKDASKLICADSASAASGGKGKGSISLANVSAVRFGPYGSVFSTRTIKSEEDWLCFSVVHSGSDGGAPSAGAKASKNAAAAAVHSDDEQASLDCVAGSPEGTVEWVLGLQAAIKTPGVVKMSRYVCLNCGSCTCC